MSNVQYMNFAPRTTSSFFDMIWKWTRAMRKAGWIYKASSDGTNKDTASTTVAAASAGVALSSFAGAGVLNVAATVASTTFPSSGTLYLPEFAATVTYTGTSGTTFTGCTTTAGSGTLLTGSTVYWANVAGQANSDKWGSNVDPSTDAYPATTIAASSDGVNLNAIPSNTLYVASTAAFLPSGSIYIGTVAQTLTYTGKTATTFTGCSVGTSAVIHTGYAVTDLDNTASWWVGQGPTTLKLSITAVPTGTFIRGETCTQATTGAEGEFVGYDYDGASTGHAVIIPRSSTPNNSLFDGSHVVTGSLSGATFTPTAINTFVMEIVFWKAAASLVTGSVYIQRVDAAVEATSRFSYLALNANCTAIVAPGGTTTAGNVLPKIGTWVALGTNLTNPDSGGSSSPTHGNWTYTSAGNLGKIQVVATNLIGAAGVSPDGTTFLVQGDAVSGTQAQFFGYFRLDDSEDADVDPFASFYCGVSTRSNATNIRVTSGTQTALGATVNFYPCSTGDGGNYDMSSWRGWRRRGWATADAFACLSVALIGTHTTFVAGDTPATPETVACAYTSKHIRDRIFLNVMDSTLKGRKGSLRWVWAIQGGTTFDTYDSLTKMVLFPYTTTYPVALVGPMDGVNTPLQA